MLNLGATSQGRVQNVGLRDSFFVQETFAKERFLNNLKSANGYYKRYCKSPLRYPGGKSLAVGLIVERLPNDIERVISPFFGGGSIEIAIANELDIQIIGYDVFDILVNFWQQAICNNAALCEALSMLKPTQKNYDSVKKELTRHWKKETALEPLVLARDYYFNFNLSYGPGFLGWMSKIYQDADRYATMLNKLRLFNANKISVECASFESVIPSYKNDFLYLDPPYYLGGDSKMFRGVYPQRNFPIHHNGFDHKTLNNILKFHKGGFILSYNDCAYIREAYKEYEILEPSWQYTMGQGETRIGKNRIERGDDDNIKKSHELLIIGERK
ncbi:MAG: DNA adenine methylase [Helicobacteraceae bacterium]|jgi:DNA adenine methylase|nr:DNA adenine methylase [Helicobacteraceae bacterium]